MIVWKPIGDLPADAEDGRDFLFWWDGDAVTAAYYGPEQGWHLRWAEQSDVKIEQFSHFAEINPPT